MSHFLSDYDFEFDESRIALRPLTPRSSAKLLVFDGEIQDHFVRDYPDILRANDLLVFNNTKVLAARLDGERHRNSAQGPVRAQISVTLLAPADENGLWQAMLKPLKKVEIGEEIAFAPNFNCLLERKEEGMAFLRFPTDGFSEKLASYGRMPLPPYIEGKRRSDAQDDLDYQPLLAQNEGAVASPTASLHFDAEIMQSFENKGIKREEVTLHVGAGTFLPVKVDDVRQHKMHAERGHIDEAVAARIWAHKQSGGRVIAVGTTALRLLESAARDGALKPFEGATDIFIKPGFEFKVVDGLITNFHLPKSTLLMLVAGFVGFDNMHKIYRHALESNYRFFSYGDSSILLPNGRK